ncbi:hypothetical protein KCTCHS21_03180 [Cohnella abietis]|uniref:Uncharacterized protein n=1 Tax=Cohnella abietis TaxID=2507935 RepID=A0A3T1CYS2_9BACL|nr:hypothetical protein KCTCHS21_03180 [Cohnella abietis]
MEWLVAEEKLAVEVRQTDRMAILARPVVQEEVQWPNGSLLSN